jgi:hypothetical protein
MNEDLIRIAIDRAIQLTEGVEAAIRPILVGHVFDSLLQSDRDIELRARPRPTPPTQVMNDEKFATLGEAIASLPTRAHTELLPAIAAYKLGSGGVESLTTDDFFDAYRELRLARPQNLSDTIAKAIRQGWLVPGEKRESKKTWRVTSLGVAKVKELRAGKVR